MRDTDDHLVAPVASHGAGRWSRRHRRPGGAVDRTGECRRREEGDGGQTNQILTGMGLGSSYYDPPATSVPSSVTRQSNTQFVPPLLPLDALLHALVADIVSGTIVTSCTGALGEQTLDGLLTWVDGSIYRRSWGLPGSHHLKMASASEECGRVDC